MTTVRGFFHGRAYTVGVKKKTLIAAFATALFAGAASAQMTPLLPGGRGNILIGTPTTLPGFMPSPVISPRIQLPSPALTPTTAIVLSPAAITAALPFPVLPMTLPAAVPAYRVTTQRMIAVAPSALRAARLSAASRNDSTEPSRDRLEKLFDGRTTPDQGPALGLPDGPSPIRPGRRINLPEQDLEDEIGAY